MQLTPGGAPRELTDAQRYQFLIEAVSDYAIYMVDREGFITSWNSGGQKLYRYRPAEIIGQLAVIACPPVRE